MLFSKTILVPANTTRTDPLVDYLRITQGNINRWLVMIPVASGWCCGIQVFHSDFQLLPLSIGEWIQGGLVTVDIAEDIKIQHPPFILEIHTFNEDLNFEHKIWFGVSVLRPTNLTEMLLEL